MIACTLFLPIFTAAKDEKYFRFIHDSRFHAKTSHALICFSLSNIKVNSKSGNRIFIPNLNLISIIEIHTHTIHPAISLALILPIQFLLTASAIFIQLRTLDMLKKENSVNNPLMVTQARIHIIFWPSIVIVNTLTDNIYPLSAIFTASFCTVLSLYFYFCTFSMIFYSFYAAFLRYVCCCYTESVNNFGKGKISVLYILYLIEMLQL